MAEKTKWTADQEKVIRLRDRNILVSAAAGSGKTAVLTERIIEMICDSEHPVDIDRLLVVTFTKAAASEMRARIEKKLEERIAEEPGNDAIQRQLSLLHNAQITTIDSFCQNIIRNYFHVINLDPSFRVADETDIKLMQTEVLSDILEECYQEGSESFLNFTEFCSPGRTDSEIEKLILNMYDIASSYPWPEEWLEQVESAYQVSTLEDLENSSWMKELLDYLKKITTDCFEMAEATYEYCENGGGAEAYLPMIKSDRDQLEAIKNSCDYKSFSEKIRAFEKMALSKKRCEGDKVRSKAMREQYLKNGLLTLLDNFFYDEPEELVQKMNKMSPIVKELVRVTKKFMVAFSDKKREEGIIDFGDMEHFALQILVDHTAEGDVPSATARELQNHYQEILTDEYQDSNFLQEMILKSLCRAPESRPYMFMVGDVKQSIYQFRLARPELFTQKYNTYSSEDSKLQRIDLHSNFRSRSIVLESANFIFRQLMQPSLGGITYDEAASLVPGRKYPDTEYKHAQKTKIILAERETEEEDPLGTISLEAAVVGQEIKRMVLGSDCTGEGETQDNSPMYILDGEKYRRVRYKDIVILLRSPGNWTEDFVEIFTEMGIPVYSETKTGYFSTIEIEIILNYLRILDNPRQDIPMASVLHSCFGDLSNEELAMLGVVPDQLNYQDGVKAYIERYDTWENSHMPEETMTEKEILGKKLKAFWQTLEKYQELAQKVTVYELLRKIYQETGYYNKMAVMPAGEKRAANLDILLQKAVDFSQKGKSGIFPFIRYIESMRKSDVDFGEASLINENMDAVRIMSIHKSKGLEFPIVFLSGLGKQFNLRDAKNAVVMEADYGVGMNYTDTKLRYQEPTLMKKFLINRIILNTLAEEIRILYVALTRAGEQLILTGTGEKIEEKMDAWDKETGEKKLSYGELTMAKTYLDWIMPIVFMDREKKYFEISVTHQQALIQSESKELLENSTLLQELRNWDVNKCYDESLEREMIKQSTYSYPYQKANSLPVKISVSELKKMARLHIEKAVDSEWDTETILFQSTEDEKETTTEHKEETIEIPRPSFMCEKQEVSGSARGTLYHLIMEHLPYQRIQEETKNHPEEWTGFEKWMKEMVSQGFVSENEKEWINPDKIMSFLNSSLGHKMYAAALDGTLQREQPFMLAIPANNIYPEQENAENILVQGIIDAWFIEKGEIVLVDYKTDFVKSGDGAELVEKYRAQLEYYAEALERLTGMTVKEKIIYSFNLENVFPIE